MQDDTQMSKAAIWGMYVQHPAHPFQGEKQKQQKTAITKYVAGKMYCCMKQSPGNIVQIQKDQETIKHLLFIGQSLVNPKYLQDIFSN